MGVGNFAGQTEPPRAQLRTILGRLSSDGRKLAFASQALRRSWFIAETQADEQVARTDIKTAGMSGPVRKAKHNNVVHEAVVVEPALLPVDRGNGHGVSGPALIARAPADPERLLGDSV